MIIIKAIKQVLTVPIPYYFYCKVGRLLLHLYGNSFTCIYHKSVVPQQEQALKKISVTSAVESQQNTRPKTKNPIMPHLVLETNLPEDNLDELPKKCNLLDTINSHS